MFDLTDDIIVAVSSAAGCSPRGILRLSGPGCLAVASAVFRSADGREGEGLEPYPGFSRIIGHVCLDEALTAPAECYLFRAPHSYTRQDCVELHTIGSVPLLAMLMDQAIAHGARPAQPGEFTARAFLAGGMDLTQVEAVAAMIRAQSDAELRASHRLRRGELASRLAVVGDRLAELVSLVEADIDFAEEPIEFITPQQLRDGLAALAAQLEDLADRADSTERLATLPRVLLVGEPNVGKSTLMNSLTGVDRSICSVVAGTTRDVLSAPMALRRTEAILLDAGGHQDEPGDLGDLTGRATRMAAAEADVICLVVDLTAAPTADVRAPLRAVGREHAIVVANKADLLSDAAMADRIAQLTEAAIGPVCPVSALTGAGLAPLRDTIEQQVTSPGVGAGGGLMLTARQRDSLARTAAAMRRAAAVTGDSADTVEHADLVAADLREALDALGEVTGAVTTDDLLGRVFASFCIGK